MISFVVRRGSRADSLQRDLDTIRGVKHIAALNNQTSANREKSRVPWFLPTIPKTKESSESYWIISTIYPATLKQRKYFLSHHW